MYIIGPVYVWYIALLQVTIARAIADLMGALRHIARREQESGNSDEHEVIRAETRYILEDPVDPVTGLPGPFYDDGSAATP